VKPQAEFDFPPQPEPSVEVRAVQGQEAWDKLLPILKSAIDRTGPKLVADLLGVGESFLSDALVERTRKYVRAEWLVVLLFIAPPAVRHEIVGEINKLAGYAAPDKRKKLTPEAELAARKKIMKRIAPGLEEMVERELQDA